MSIKSLYIILATIILLSNICFAKNNQSNKNHKLSYEEFIIQYGVDDTSKAIIEIYFDKQEYSGVGKISFLPIAGVVTLIVPPIGVGLIAISSPLFVSGLLTCNKYNKKKLLKTLLGYQNNNVLSRSNKKKISRLMKAQKEINNEDLSEERLATLRSIRESGTPNKLISINQLW